MMNTYEVKTVLIGDSGVGKTSIVYRFVTDNFDEHKDATMGAGFMTKMLSSNEQNIRFQIWDTAGQEKDADVAIIVYDVANQQSYEVLQKWIIDLKQNGPKDLMLYLVGNKIDLEDYVVDYDQASELAAEHDAIIKLTSAKDNMGVQELFQSIADEIVFKNKTKREQGTTINPTKVKQKTNGCKC